MSILVSTLVADTRLMSDLKNNQVCTDPEIAMYLSDAGSELYDEFTETNQHYNIKTFDFTLSGGVGDTSGINLWDLSATPGDFQQGHSLELNPDTPNPITVEYLSNWLNRNDATGGIFVAGNCLSRSYCFSGDLLRVFPPLNAAGAYRLYYTPTWTALALPSSITVDTVSIPVVPTTTMGFTAGATFKLDTGPDTFVAADVGNFIEVTGATNPGNNGFWTISAFHSATEVGVPGSPISETFPGGATVNLFRQSNVTAGGLWTFYGTNQFTATTADVNVGDTINVAGAANTGNNGSFVVTAVGLNTVTTAASGLVAENFATGTVSVTVQPASTRPDLPAQMNSWALYLKTHASITIRTKRDQNVDALEAKLSGLKQRIASVLQNRQEEPTQPPLTRNTGGIYDWNF